MLSFMLLLSFFTAIFSYTPSCDSCKFFIRNNKGSELGYCKLFKNIVYKQGKEVIIHDFAVHCRNNEDMCGKEGNLYESLIENKNEKIYNDLIDEYDELKNRCCGEVNEKDELEQLERDFFEIFQKIKSHNKKRIYKTTKDLYKLFKRNNE
jgi:hypothetical protein